MDLKEVTYEVLATGDKMPSGYYMKADVDAVLAEKDKEIALLKERICNGDVSRATWIDDCFDKDKEIAKLKEERRWRKFSEEEPEHHQWILVFSHNHSQFTTGVELRRWDDGCKYDVEVQEIYEKWMPLPSAPKEA